MREDFEKKAQEFKQKTGEWSEHIKREGEKKSKQRE